MHVLIPQQRLSGMNAEDVIRTFQRHPERECMFCRPIRVKCSVASEVGKHDSSDREDYYFDCEEPSSDEESCVHVSE